MQTDESGVWYFGFWSYLCLPLIRGARPPARRFQIPCFFSFAMKAPSREYELEVGEML